MSFLSGFEAVIQGMEKEAEKVFADIFRIAVAAQPIVDLASVATGNAALGALYNQTVSAVGAAQQAAIAAGMSQSNTTNAAKQAAVIQSIAGSVDKIDKQFGIKVDVAPWVAAAVASVKAVTPSVATPAAP